ncbi:hypothetical protein [Flavobacterium crassostreae]|uniref:Lipoprotein n=1 Tax=Flavobacterium crassostreae TaxID=1763534 RepID=A0A1B9E5L9_9FLAO|nr:hypothetical protein [Flavobacterium crassostreae]OCB77264.1 hypothetical protein LPBF_04505 [Flavobacterium crassostreae]
MKSNTIAVFLVLLLFVSCKEENSKKNVATTKELKKKELLLSTISNAWDFYDTPINQTAEQSVVTWTELRNLLQELHLKPKGTISAFQQKATAIATAATALSQNIPQCYNQPEIKSRIGTLITKIKLLDLYLHLDAIAQDKVVQIIPEINKELASLQRQMDKIVVKSNIPTEQGESELKQMKDASRAISNQPTDQNLPRVD